MKSPILQRLRNRALEDLNTRDMEGRKAARLKYRHIQALEEGRWTEGRPASAVGPYARSG